MGAGGGPLHLIDGALPRLPVPGRPWNPILDVYTVDEDSRTVDILSFWNTSRDPDTVEL
jgi:hypothetical protein